MNNNVEEKCKLLTNDNISKNMGDVIISTISDEIILYHNDALNALKKIRSNSVKLIYIDPPFFTDKDFKEYSKNGNNLYYFSDKFIKDTTGKKDINVYLAFMRPIIQEIYRILTDDGSFYLHCDYHANSYLRLECDKIFNKEPRAEIIWHSGTSSGFKGQKKGFIRNHDTIYSYTKSDEFTFNILKGDLAENTIKRYNKTDENGRKYKSFFDKDKHERRSYLNIDGKPLDDVWDDIPSFMVSNNTGEQIGYPTQKPEELLRRIIESSSNEGDLILDCFCGSGTTIAVGHKLKRKVIGIDASPYACIVTANRIHYSIKLIKDLCLDYDTILNQWNPIDFQNWVCDVMNCVRGKNGSDKGFDGWFNEYEPIQVKNYQASRKHLSEFIGDIIKENERRKLSNSKYHTDKKLIKKGWIFAPSFSSEFISELSICGNEIKIKYVNTENVYNQFKETWEKEQNIKIKEESLTDSFEETKTIKKQRRNYFEEHGTIKRGLFKT